MNKKLDLNEFFKLYNNELLPKEDILKELNITEYFYKKIIKEYQLKRKRTSEFNRIKINNSLFVIPKKEEIEVIKRNSFDNIDTNAINLLNDALKATDKTLNKVRNKKFNYK